jgi:hypothetical protein
MANKPSNHESKTRSSSVELQNKKDKASSENKTFKITNNCSNNAKFIKFNHPRRQRSPSKAHGRRNLDLLAQSKIYFSNKHIRKRKNVEHKNHNKSGSTRRITLTPNKKYNRQNQSTQLCSTSTKQSHLANRLHTPTKIHNHKSKFKIRLSRSSDPKLSKIKGIHRQKTAKSKLHRNHTPYKYNRSIRRALNFDEKSAEFSRINNPVSSTSIDLEEKDEGHTKEKQAHRSFFLSRKRKVYQIRKLSDNN